MRARLIDITTFTTASSATVYRLLADGSTWPSWSPVESVESEPSGADADEGVGAVRVLRRGRVTGRDQILELVPDRRFAYASLSGLPVRDYRAEVDLRDAPNGLTAINWRASFLPKHRGTGWILERGIRRFLGQCAQGLADGAAELEASS